MDKKKVKLRKEHYYMENGLLVFTEIYHLEKGYCCENNCRHCPYTPKKSKTKKTKYSLLLQQTMVDLLYNKTRVYLFLNLLQIVLHRQVRV